ncbi:MAG: FtsX-like permease family protein [Terriglobales bacterium]
MFGKTPDKLLSLLRTLSTEKWQPALRGIFGIAALLRASTGIYAVISYSVAQRTHELGIRMALGAQQLDVLKLVVGSGLKIAFVGVALGLAGAYTLTRVLSNLLYGISVNDLATFVSMSVLLIIIALAASYIPARRAAKVDPVIALRSE